MEKRVPADHPPEMFAWRVVAVAFCVAMFAWGVGFYGPSILMQALHTARGWPISTISAAISAHFLLSAAIVAYLPVVHRRFGVPNVTLAGVCLAALGTLAWANVQTPSQLFLAVLLSSPGWAATSGAAINAIVSPWFDRDRAKALSMAFNGASVGGVVCAPLWVALISSVGLPAASMVIAGAMILVLSPLVLGVLRTGSGRKRQSLADPALHREGLSRARLLRDPRFVKVSAGFALGLFAQVGLLAHLLTRLEPVLGTGGAAWALSATAASAVAGRTLLAWLLGGRNRRMAAGVNFLVQATGVVLLAAGGTPAPVLAGCILFGLGVGNLISLPPLIAQQEFEPQDVATVVALVTAMNQAVFACAPAAFGLLRDLTGNYVAAFALAACAQVAAALVVSRGVSRSRR